MRTPSRRRGGTAAPPLDRLQRRHCVAQRQYSNSDTGAADTMSTPTILDAG